MATGYRKLPSDNWVMTLREITPLYIAQIGRKLCQFDNVGKEYRGLYRISSMDFLPFTRKVLYFLDNGITAGNLYYEVIRF